MQLDLSSLSPNQAYHTLSQTLIPRPIAWVLSDSQRDVELATADRYNLAPFSFFTPIGSNPPMLMISVGKKPDTSPKDTRANIAHHGHFVVHIAPSNTLEAVNQSAATLPLGESEVSQNNLSLTDFPGCPLPRLEVASAALHCELHRIDEIGNTPQALIFGEVKQVWINDKAIDKHQAEPFRLKINAEKIDPLARLGGAEYASLGEIIARIRPQ